MTLSITSRRPRSPRRGVLRLLSAGAATVVLAAAPRSAPTAASRRSSRPPAAIGKEVRWARSDSDRELIDQRVGELLAAAAVDRRRRAAGAAEQPRPAGRVLRAGHLRGRAGAGRPAAEPRLQLRPLTKGDEVEIERGLHLNLARLLAMPLLQDVESRRFAQAQGWPR